MVRQESCQTLHGLWEDSVSVSLLSNINSRTHFEDQMWRHSWKTRIISKNKMSPNKVVRQSSLYVTNLISHLFGKKFGTKRADHTWKSWKNKNRLRLPTTWALLPNKTYHFIATLYIWIHPSNTKLCCPWDSFACFYNCYALFVIAQILRYAAVNKVCSRWRWNFTKFTVQKVLEHELLQTTNHDVTLSP